MFTIKSGNVTYDDASVPAAQEKLLKANEFKTATFIYEADEAVSLAERQHVQSAVTVMFNRAHTQDTPSALAEYIQSDLRTLNERAERLALQLRQVEYPLPLSFKSAREIIQRVTTHTRPNKVVRMFLENLDDLKQLNADADTLHKFVEMDKRLPVYRQARELLKAYQDAQRVYSTAALRQPAIVEQAKALAEAVREGAAGERWEPFERAYLTLLGTFRSVYEEQHTRRDQLYARLNNELANEGIQIEHFQTYACAGLKFAPAAMACAACGVSFNMLAEQMLGMPEAARLLRDKRKNELAASSAPQRTVKRISVSTLLAGREFDEGNLDEALSIIRDAAQRELDQADTVGLKVLEVRRLIPEIIQPRSEYGQRSRAHRDYRETHPTESDAPDDALEAAIKSVCRLVYPEFRILFDVGDPSEGREPPANSLIWPSYPVLKACLAKINALDTDAGRSGLPAYERATPEQSVWAEDEIIGWIYQFYNAEEKAAIRDRGKPKHPAEVAVINQFFTPRWIVKFLVDNTLGRL